MTFASTYQLLTRLCEKRAKIILGEQDTAENMTKAESLIPEAASDPVIRQIFELVPDAKDEVVVEALLQDKALRESLKVSTPSRVSFELRMWSRIKAVGMLYILLFITLPISLFGMANFIFWHILFHKDFQSPRIPPGWRGTALVSGGNKGKALAVIRHLHRAGWRVVLVEVQTGWGCGTRFSNCVSAFYSTPRPNTDPVGYLKAVRDVAHREAVNLFVPVSMAQYSVYEALACKLMPPNTICCTTDAHMTAVLNDKVSFTAFAQQHGLAVPEIFSITSKEQLLEYNRRASELFKGRRYLLKSVAYEAISRADLFTLPCSQKRLERYIQQYEMSHDRPWLLQTFLEGPEFSCYTLAYRGKVVAHVDNVAELSCLRYNHVGISEIKAWVEQFCESTGASGQLCFDFMYDRPGGSIYCIEANPRTSTNLMAFYNQPLFAHAYFEPQLLISEGKTPVQPLGYSRLSYWIWNELGELLLGELLKVRNLEGVQQFLRVAEEKVFTVLRGRDAVFDAEDPVPFLALHYLQMTLALLRVVRLGTPWLKLDLCSGKVVELGGD